MIDWRVSPAAMKKNPTAETDWMKAEPTMQTPAPSPPTAAIGLVLTFLKSGFIRGPAAQKEQCNVQCDCGKGENE